MFLIANNKKALHEFEILEDIEAGIVLASDEIKSVRANKVSLQGSFVRIGFKDKNSKVAEAFLVNTNFSGALAPTRSKKLLLNRKEINRLLGKTIEKNLTLIPLKLYLTKRGLAKVQIALGRGLKKYDKRERLKKKHQKRDLEREM